MIRTSCASRCLWWCLLGAAASALAGCGPADGIYPARGTVSFSDGTKVPGGKVEFTSVDKQITAVGNIGRDGAFTLSTNERNDGAPLGKLKVAVLAPDVGPPEDDDEDITGGDLPPVPAVDIPERYQNVETSGLEFEVTADSDKNVFDIVIERE